MYFRKHGTTGKSIFEYISRFFAGDKIRPREDSIRSLEKSRRNGKKGKYGTIGKVFPRKGRKNCEGIKFSSCICILWGTRIKMYQLSYSFGIEKKNTRSVRARLTRYREREPFVNRHYKKTRLLLDKTT